MPPSGAKGPTLPLHLLKELGADGDSGPRGKGGKGKGRELSRKERRKAERNQKKGRAAPVRNGAGRATAPGPKRGPPPKGAALKGGAPKPILKQERPEPEDEDDEDPFGDEEDEDMGADMDEDDEEDLDVDMDEDEEHDGEGFSDEEPSPPKKNLPKVVQEKLAEDDAEIAALERKLGIKGRKKLPQSFKDDGLGDLLADLDGGSEDEEKQEKRKRKAEADEWLASKRRKAAAAEEKGREAQQESEESDEGSEGFDDDFDDDDLEKDDLDGELEDSEEGSEDGFEGFGEDDNESDNDDGDEEEEEKPKPRVRENPYVAPTTGQQPAKYVPPSLRKETGSDAELVARIRRQTQGLVNRVTEANLVSIVGDIEKLYRDNPRQHVSSSLVDLLLIQVCEPTALPDTLLILNAGFATAVYKVIGMDFGAQLIQELVERYQRYYDEAKEAASLGPDVSKQTSNLITFLAQLYNFQLVGPNLLFDYIRLLLSDLSELNAELLLRIVRMSGPALRQDDPMALKDIVTLIRPAVAKVGEANLSVRTKFMIDTIYDLKNNKMKAGASASAVVSEHSTRMKKTLGTLNSRKLKSTESLRIGLKDIRDSDKKGKWWLVGASWAGPSADDKKNKGAAATEQDDESDDESIVIDDFSDGAPDIAELARQQMMNTDVRRSIFVAIASACDYEDAYIRITKLRLNKERQKEIPFVVMQCCGAEQIYNPYYTLVAKKLCVDRKTKWSFQNSLWKLFRRLGESIFGDDGDDIDDSEEIDLRRIVNNAKMFGTLVAEGVLGLGILKCLNLPYMQKKTKMFVEVMLITVLQECQANEGGGEAAISTVFKAVEGIPELARGLQWFLKKVLRKTDLAGGKAETKRLKEACKAAEKAIEAALLAEEVGLE